MVQLPVEPWVEQLGLPLTQTKNRTTPVRTGKHTIKKAAPGMSILVHASVHLARLKRGVADFQGARKRPEDIQPAMKTAPEELVFTQSRPQSDIHRILVYFRDAVPVPLIDATHALNRSAGVSRLLVNTYFRISPLVR